MFRRKIRKGTIKRILIITLSNVGDVVLTTPAIARLRENFPDAHITVLVGPKAYPLLEHSATVNEVICYDKHAPLGGKFGLIKSLRARRFDLVVDFKQTLIPVFLGASERTRLLSLPQPHTVSMREKFLHLLDSWDLEAKAHNTFNFFSAADNGNIRKRLEEEGIFTDTRFAVVAAGARSEVKRWPVERFCDVCDTLGRKAGVRVILAGDEVERPVLDTLSARCREPLVNWAGRTTLRELAALIAGSSLVVANDSAVMHLANELGIPSVAVFGPTSERKYGGRGAKSVIVRRSLACTPCELAQCREGIRSCLDELSSREVEEAALRLLNEK